MNEHQTVKAAAIGLVHASILFSAALLYLAVETMAHVDDYHELVATSAADKTRLAFTCQNGQYAVVLSRNETSDRHTQNLRASEPTSRIRWRVLDEKPVEDNWRRAAETENAWFPPNPRTWTRTLAWYDMQKRVTLEIWLPGDDRNKPGRRLDLHQKALLPKAWLMARTC